MPSLLVASRLSAATTNVAATRPREAWVDVYKALAIFLIAFGHLPQSKLTECFLWTFHVPAFFLVAGYLSHVRPMAQTLQRITFRILVPYVSCYLVLTAIAWWQRESMTARELGTILLGVFYGTDSYPGFVSAPLWFFPSIMTVELFYAGVVRRWKAAYVVALVISIWLYRRGMVNIWMSLDLSLLGLNFCVAGRLAALARLPERLSHASVWVRFALFLACLLSAYQLARFGNVWYAGGYYSLSLIGGLVGSLMLICLGQLLPGRMSASAPVRFVSENTLFLMCFHPVGIYYAGRLLGLGAAHPLSSGILTVTLAFLLLVPPNLLVLRFLPEMIGVRRPGGGGRGGRPDRTQGAHEHEAEEHHLPLV